VRLNLVHAVQAARVRATECHVFVGSMVAVAHHDPDVPARAHPPHKDSVAGDGPGDAGARRVAKKIDELHDVVCGDDAWHGGLYGNAVGSDAVARYVAIGAGGSDAAGVGHGS